MFFVTVTGNLMPLILIASLPFVFFVPKSPDIQMEAAGHQIEVQHIGSGVITNGSCFDYASVHASALSPESGNEIPFCCAYCIYRPSPFVFTGVFTLNDSGNKAPPFV